MNQEKRMRMIRRSNNHKASNRKRNESMTTKLYQSKQSIQDLIYRLYFDCQEIQFVNFITTQYKQVNQQKEMMRSASSYSMMSRDNKENISCRMNRSTKDYNLQSKISNNTSSNFNSILAWSSMPKRGAKLNKRHNEEIVSTIEETQRDEDYGQEVSRISADGNRSVMTNCLISNANNCKSINNRSINHYSQKQKRLKILTQSDLTDDNDYDNLSQQLFSQRTNDEPQQMVLKSYNISEQNQYHSKENGIKSIVKKENRSNQAKVKGVEQEAVQQAVESPPFILIPNYKLQVKNYHITNTFISLSTLINLLKPKPTIKTITKLTITNCLLNSLEGIQSFEQLEQLNVRKNELRQVQQLYKISKKQKVTMINIQGNDIEYYHMATYGNLKKVFINLVELNDKNYGMLEKKNSKYRDMRNVLKKSTKLQCQLKNQLKKEIKRTDRAMIRYNPSAFAKCKYQQEVIDEQQQREFNEEETFKKNSVNKSLRYNELKSNRKSKCLIESNSYTHQMSNNNRSDCQEGHYSLGQQHDGQSFKKDASQQVGKQLSLASIENVPLTKSVNMVKPLETRGNNSDNILSNTKLGNKINQIPLQTLPARGLLQIKTQNLDDENGQQQFQNNSQLHQPTATFAMQLQKQQQYALENKQFMFRNNVSKKHQPGMQKTTKLSCNSNNKSLVLMINDNQQQQQYNRQISQQQQQNEQLDELMSYDKHHESMSLSQISDIPTKRMSKEKRVMSNNNRKLQQQLYSKGNSNNGDYIHDEQSFITTTAVNDYFVASRNNNTLLNNYNNSYLAYSQFTQYKPNQSMDDDCLLKQNKNSLEQEKLAIATAVYLRSLITKSLYALSIQSGKRKNLPKRKQHLRNFVN